MTSVDQAMELAAREILGGNPGNVVHLTALSDIEKRRDILQRDVAYQEEREAEALRAMRAEMGDIKQERAMLKEREARCRLRFQEICETTDALARASRAALKELGE